MWKIHVLKECYVYVRTVWKFDTKEIVFKNNEIHERKLSKEFVIMAPCFIECTDHHIITIRNWLNISPSPNSVIRIKRIIKTVPLGINGYICYGYGDLFHVKILEKDGFCGYEQLNFFKKYDAIRYFFLRFSHSSYLKRYNRTLWFQRKKEDAS